MPRLNGRNATPAMSGPKPSTPWTYWTTRKNIDRFGAEEQRHHGQRADAVAVADQSAAAPGGASAAARSREQREQQGCRPRSRSGSGRGPAVPGVPIRVQTRATAPAVAVSAPTTSKRPGRRGLGDEPGREQHHGEPDRHVDEQRPAPGADVGEQATEDQADGRAAGGHRTEEGERAVAGRLVPGALVVEQGQDAPGPRARRRRPWKVRAATSWPGVWASPPRAEPTVKTSRPASKTLGRPKTSPRRPPSSSRPPKASV